MTDFCTLTSGIKAAIGQFAPSQIAGVSIVIEDDENLGSMIAKATGQIGMLVFIGIPHFKNEDGKLASLINATLNVEVLIREVPTIWRRSANQNPIHCSDLGQAVAAAVQGAGIAGFQPLRVISGMPLGKLLADPGTVQPPWQDYLVIIETMQIFNLSSG